MTATLAERPPSPPQPPADAPRDVLFVEGSGGFGGSTVGLARLVAGLPAARWRAHVVVAHRSQAEYLERAGVAGPGSGVDVAVIPPPVARRGAFSRLDLAWRTLRHVRALRRFAAGRGIDLVHLNNSVSINMGGILLARWLRVPCVVKQRGFEWDSRVNRRLARMVDWYVPDSRAVCGRLERLGAAPERMTVTYCTVDLDEYDVHEPREAVRAELGLDPRAPLVGIVGCLVDWKGQDVFLDAAARVLEHRPDVRAIVVGDTPDGGPSPYAARLRERHAALGLGDRVRFLGHRDDVPRVLHAMDVCVHASTKPEPFGTVCAEAMAMRVPIVAADDGGPPEYVRDGETGLLAPPGDAASVAASVLRLLSDAGLRERVVRNVRREVEERFALPRHVAETLRVYEHLTARAR